MKKRSLKFKLIIGGILAVIVPLTVVGLFAINKSSTTLVATAKGQASQIAANLAAMADVTVEQEIKLAKQLAIEPLVVDAARKVVAAGVANARTEVETLDGFLGKVFGQIGVSYDLLFVADAGGITIADSMGGALRAKKISLADRDYFIAAKAGKLSIGTPVRSRASGKPVFVVAVPLKPVPGNLPVFWEQ